MHSLRDHGRAIIPADDNERARRGALAEAAVRGFVACPGRFAAADELAKVADLAYRAGVLAQQHEQGEGEALKRAGWREYVALPEWGIRRLRAKLDTGARTSAIHVGAIEHIDDEHVRFEVIVREHPTPKTRWVEGLVSRRTVVKPSSGQRQERIVCTTLLRLGAIERRIEVSLVCRKGMLCRMLVGRTALAGCITVDPAATYVLSDPPRKKRSSS